MATTRRVMAFLHATRPEATLGGSDQTEIDLVKQVSPDAPVTVVQTLNGQLQVSVGKRGEAIGLLVERDGHAVGTLLSEQDAEQLAELLARHLRFARSPAHQSADG